MNENTNSLTPEYFISVGETVEYSGGRAVVQGLDTSTGRLLVLLNVGEKEPIRVPHREIKKISRENNIILPSMQ